MSNTFAKIDQNQYALYILDFTFSMMSYISLIFLPINLFCTNPFWSLCIILSNVNFVLSARMPLNISYVKFYNVIGLQFFVCLLSFPRFGKQVIISVFCCSVRLCLLKYSLNEFNIRNLVSSQNVFKNS